MPLLYCPSCSSDDLDRHGEPSFVDGQFGFRCRGCQLELAPPRGLLTRSLLLAVPIVAVLFGSSLVIAAIALIVRGAADPFGGILGFAGGLGILGGMIAFRPTLREVRRPRPTRRQVSRSALPARQGSIATVPAPTRPPKQLPLIDGHRLCHFHIGFDGAASGLGGLFPIWFIVVMVASLIVFKTFRVEHFLFDSPYPEILTAAVTIAGCWLMGRYLNRNAPRRFFEFPQDFRDARTGEVVTGTYGHTFLFVRLEYWGLAAVPFYWYVCGTNG